MKTPHHENASKIVRKKTKPAEPVTETEKTNSAYPLGYEHIGSDPRPVDEPIHLQVTTLLNEFARQRGLTYRFEFVNGGSSLSGLFDRAASERKVVFTGEVNHKPVTFVIELDRWFKEHATGNDWSEFEFANSLVNYILEELDRLRAKRASSHEDDILKANGLFIKGCEEFAKDRGLEFRTGSTLIPDHVDDPLPKNIITFEKTYEKPVVVYGETLKRKSVTIDTHSDSLFADCFMSHGIMDYPKALTRVKRLVYDQLLSYGQEPSEISDNAILNKPMNIPIFPADEEAPQPFCKDAFVSMFINGAIDKIHKDAPCIPHEWIVEFCHRDEFHTLCISAATAVRSFCDFIKDKVEENGGNNTENEEPHWAKEGS